MRQFNVSACVVGVLVLAAAAVPVRAEPPSLETLQKARKELERDYEKLSGRLYEVRRRAERAPEFSAAARALTDARRAYDKKVLTDPRIVAARKARDEAQAARAKLLAAEWANDPEAAAARRTLAGAEAELLNADSDHRIATFILAELRRKTARSPDVAAAAAAARDAERVAEDLVDNLPALVDLRHARADAADAFDVGGGTPEQRRARDDAQRAYDEALKASKEVAEARAARDATRQALDRAIDEVVKASPVGAEQVRKIAEAEERITHARAAVTAATDAEYKARSKVTADDNEKLAAIRKAAEEAYAAQEHALTEAAATERAAVETARKALAQLVDAKLAKDPAASELIKQAEELKQQIDVVRKQVQALQEAAAK